MFYIFSFNCEPISVYRYIQSNIVIDRVPFLSFSEFGIMFINMFCSIIFWLSRDQPVVSGDDTQWNSSIDSNSPLHLNSF